MAAWGRDRDPAGRRPARRGLRPPLACGYPARAGARCFRLPQQVRDGAKAAGRKIALRADAGYFAGDLARAAIKHEMEFAIGAKRISSMWRALAGIDEDAWRDGD